ncbi:MAG: ABC transporter permease, partial [Verrucomicrobiae bacterium]|nr:ABC transporter permease [Verrucomicrobiae bacterium]
RRPGEAVSAGYAQVSPGYFRTLNIPLLQGRDFTEQDAAGTPPALVVDETFVRNFQLGTNVLGRRVRIGDRLDQGEIIGVVKDIKRTGMADTFRGEVYRASRQICWGNMALVVRSQREPGELARAIRGELNQMDRDVPIQGLTTLTQLVATSVAPRRLSTQLLGAFAGVALLLAALGLYGVLAYAVTQRRQEIGIRMALGAQRHDVFQLVLGQGLRLMLLGLALGVAGAIALTRVLEQLLFQTSARDPLTFALVTITLCAAAAIACWLPARRAARVDPMEALRSE